MRPKWVAFAMAATVSLGLTIVPAWEASASPFPSVVSGTTNCTGAGTLVLRTNFSRSDGLFADSYPAGSPVGGWSRTVKPVFSSPEFNVDWDFVSPTVNARWDLSTVVDPPGFGIAGPLGRCTHTALSGTALQTVSLGSKTCPAGQTVLIATGNYGEAGHSWKVSGSTSTNHAFHPGAPSLNIQITDTGAGSVNSVVVTGYAVPGYHYYGFTEHIFECSASEGVS